jgi:hypothetical protein
MAYSFKLVQGINPGRAAFGVFNESLEAGEYILNKKAKATFCRPDVCKGNKKVGSQGQLLLLNKSNYLHYYTNPNSYNPSQLNSNLVTTLDLSGVPVMQSNSPPFETPTPIKPHTDPTSRPYLDYIIDPSGNLFGNTQCGIYNFLNYRVYNPHYNNPNPGYINNL